MAGPRGKKVSKPVAEPIPMHFSRHAPTRGEVVSVLRHPVVVSITVAFLLWAASRVYDYVTMDPEIMPRVQILEENAQALEKYYGNLNDTMTEQAKTSKRGEIRVIQKELAELLEKRTASRSNDEEARIELLQKQMESAWMELGGLEGIQRQSTLPNVKSSTGDGKDPVPLAKKSVN